MYLWSVLNGENQRHPRPLPTSKTRNRGIVSSKDMTAFSVPPAKRTTVNGGRHGRASQPSKPLRSAPSWHFDIRPPFNGQTEHSSSVRTYVLVRQSCTLLLRFA